MWGAGQHARDRTQPAFFCGQALAVPTSAATHTPSPHLRQQAASRRRRRRTSLETRSLSTEPGAAQPPGNSCKPAAERAAYPAPAHGTPAPCGPALHRLAPAHDCGPADTRLLCRQHGSRPPERPSATFCGEAKCGRAPSITSLAEPLMDRCSACGPACGRASC